MKQVTQVLRTGAIEVIDVPVPLLSDNFVLVRNEASLISVGTEKTKIDMGKKSLLQKARARPDLVQQVLKKIRTEGLRKTMQTVSTRLDAFSPLGYSCAGTVLAVGGKVNGLRPGDRVACGGADYANHAEIVAVPGNLVVPVPDHVAPGEACFATIGAIALQGLRLAEPRLGETFLVVGLGLLGQIMVQLLRANGCRAIGTDLDAALVERARSAGATGVSPTADLVQACLQETQGRGVDGVLVCAGSSSNSIIETAGEVTRDKGRVIVVGAVRMDIPREPFFRKEVSVVVSRSYGPGRYDPSYEEGGVDYPLGYVRFTEQRNMETIIAMIADRSLDVRSLISHRFAVEDAASAYGLIHGEARQPYLGIVLQYPHDGSVNVAAGAGLPARGVQEAASSGLRISLFGAGNYATASLLPVLQGIDEVEFAGVVTSSGRTAESVRRKFGFAFCEDGIDGLLGPGTDVLLVASRHDTHASAVTRAIEAGKCVYVEKPLALTMEQLAAVSKALRDAPSVQLMVGFNRRFAPATRQVMAHLAGVHGPRSIAIRVNAGAIPRNHWIQDPDVGGGRIIGEACHFIDLASTLAGSLPASVHAVAMADPAASAVTSDNVHISLTFRDGSVASVVYVSAGSRAMPKERIEVFAGGRAAVIDDFRKVQLYSGDSGSSQGGSGGQDKGQEPMLKEWVAGLRSGKPCVDAETLVTVSAATILAVESLTLGMPLDVSAAVRALHGED